MAPATALQDELAEEILLRLPPDDPALLVRTALTPASAAGSASSTARRHAAVFCADAGCSHLDCRHNPFTVIYVSIIGEWKMEVYIYSSEAVQWHLPSVPYAAAQQGDYLDLGPSVLVGNLLYFVLRRNTRILEYNVATREMGVVHLPPGCFSERRNMLMTAEDGCLGFATVHKSKLCLWSKENGSDKDAGWAQRRVIDLKMLLPIRSLLTPPHVVGFANGIGVIFVHTCDGLFTIDLNSSRVKKARKASDGSRVFPYMSYCTPALRAATTSTDEGPTMGASSASDA
ncbi:hypothetical protein SORBI_3002G019400 [Sorghum bicolor]|uniref:F-box protein AT5G49610-like beta-propeller domain-containing protein n=1 Tax=Sorghum bicolor TaxID=4558 RepID=A0A1W0W1X6_SORBI|nr:hypothetical protein SORBI_3002G019400 [Sorghum bicolor]